jgi:LemA protein
MSPYVILGIVALLIGWVVVTYNLLVGLRQHCRDAWSGIDTELKRRYDLIPNLVATVKGYAQHERQVFESVTAARARAVASRGSAAKQADDEKRLVSEIDRLLAVSERYPELKASSNFLALQDELANTEDRIQAARRFYNGNVRDLNTRIESFPSNLIASAFSFAKEEYFEVESSKVRRVVAVSFDG